MSHFSVFLNTAVLDTGSFARIGDTALTPFRYLFHGKDIQIITHQQGKTKTGGQEAFSSQDVLKYVHHVASFHINGDDHMSRTQPSLTSSPTSMLKTALSVVLLVPGLIAGILFKGLSYLSATNRENHRLIKWHFTPEDIILGSNNDRISKIEDLEKRLTILRQGKPLPVTGALVIYGQAVHINRELGIINYFHPEKLILDGAWISSSTEKNTIGHEMKASGKWIASAYNVSVEEALKAPRPQRSWFPPRQFRVLFT